MTHKTPLHSLHLGSDAKMVDFAGYSMPLHYGSTVDEHLEVRKSAGMFDVSHMGIIDVTGEDALAFLKKVMANDPSKCINRQKALYSCLLNEQGGILDDLICYPIRENYLRLVVNAGTKAKIFPWLKSHQGSENINLTLRDDLAIIAVQGPNALEHTKMLADLVSKASLLNPFELIGDENSLVSLTGYTGERGYEWMLPAQEAKHVWLHLKELGVQAIGLSARDTLRLEAGFHLSGQDMNETITPLESGLSWTVDFSDVDRDFIGKSALIVQKESKSLPAFKGFVLEGGGVLRTGMRLLSEGQEVGVLTSGGFGPSLSKSIALARYDRSAKQDFSVDIRGRSHRVFPVKLPFIRNGQPTFTLEA